MYILNSVKPNIKKCRSIENFKNNWKAKKFFIPFSTSKTHYRLFFEELKKQKKKKKKKKQRKSTATFFGI